MSIRVVIKSDQPQAKRVIVTCRDMKDATMAIRQQEPRKTASA